MKAAFSAEAIGWGDRIEIRSVPWDSMPWVMSPQMPWVAEITGTDPRYGLARCFLRHKADYRDANRQGTRGVRWWWTLESGRVYEARYRTAWDCWHARFLSVGEDGEISDMTREEVTAWASATSAPTS